MKKKTKIVATISDRNCEPGFIARLYDAGMNAVRLNTAHQSLEQTLKVINNVRKVSEKIPIIIDTKGPEIRITKINEDIFLNEGDKILISGGPEKESSREILYVNYKDFVNETGENSKILIDDGSIELSIQKKEKNYLVCRATNSGIIKGNKSVNVPGASFNLPAVSKKDKEYINFSAINNIDFIAHSFVRNKEDVFQVKKILDKLNSSVRIIAKIENKEGVKNIDEILNHVDGVMVARGDLAIEIPYEKIPGIQKMIINKCIQHRKPVIIATQMLHSMIENPRPTRAEVSDIANAIYSKTDAIMLSGETASGKYPLEALRTMAKVAVEVEKTRSNIHETESVVLSTETSAILSRFAVEASIKLGAEAIIADTTSGRTIRNMAGFRGRKIIYAICYDENIVRALGLSFGVYPQYLKPDKSNREFVRKAIKNLLESKDLKDKDKVVILGGNFGKAHGASHIEITSVKNLAGELNI